MIVKKKDNRLTLVLFFFNLITFSPCICALEKLLINYSNNNYYQYYFQKYYKIQEFHVYINNLMKLKVKADNENK